MDTKKAAVLQVLLTKVMSGYEAHCLPMDIVTEAPTVDQAIEDICDLISAQYRYARDTDNLDSIFVPAPAEYWQKLAFTTVFGTRDISVDGPSEHCNETSRKKDLTVELEMVGV
jgi:hypothetical protein